MWAPTRCPDGLFSRPASDLIIWVLCTAVSVAVNLSLIILGALYNDPELCRVLQVPQMMIFCGSFGLAMTLINISVLWQLPPRGTILLFMCMHFAAFLYATVITISQDPNGDKSSPSYCGKWIPDYTMNSYFIMPLCFGAMRFGVFIVKKCSEPWSLSLPAFWMLHVSDPIWKLIDCWKYCTENKDFLFFFDKTEG